MLVLCSFLLLSVTLLCYYCKTALSYWKKQGIPCIEPAFPWGNLKENGKFLTLKRLLDGMYDKRTKSFPFVGGYIFIKPIIVTTDLNLVKNILISDFHYFEDRGTYSNERDDPLSAHLFTLDGSKWKILRTKMTPTFSMAKIKYMYPTIVKVAERLDAAIEQVLQQADNNVEVTDLLARYFTDVIGACVFGIECHSLADPHAEFRKYGRLIFEKPRLKPILRAFTLIFPELSQKLGIKVTQDAVTEFFMKIVRETMEYRDREKVRRNDFMDILLELRRDANLSEDENDKLGKLQFREIVAQAFLFFFAGFESSAATMSFALYELTVNEHVQNRACQEISDILLKYNGVLTYEALNDMKYLDQIITETLRKNPPVIFLIRKAVRNYKVPNHNQIIQKGTTIFIPVECIHHDPEIYPDPKTFDPDRFTPEAESYRPSSSFLAFGDGPRNCIGSRFGHIQIKVGLIVLLKKFKFTKCSKTRIPMEFSKFTPILKPRDGIWLNIKKIQNSM